MEQQTVTMEGEAITMDVHGRHDPCVLPRAVPIVEAMAAMTILDALLISTTEQTLDNSLRSTVAHLLQRIRQRIEGVKSISSHTNHL